MNLFSPGRVLRLASREVHEREREEQDKKVQEGGIPEWPKGPDCKSGGVSLRRFESCFPQFPSAGFLIKSLLLGLGRWCCGGIGVAECLVLNLA